mgnify:CR=1 FL=1
MKPIEVVILGAGGRGHYAYGNWILDHPDQIRVVAESRDLELRVGNFKPVQYIPWDTTESATAGIREFVRYVN